MQMSLIFVKDMMTYVSKKDGAYVYQSNENLSRERPDIFTNEWRCCFGHD